MPNRDRVVLITGAARGIGRQTALLMARAGARVGVVDILSEVEQVAHAIEQLGRESAAAVFDIADPAAVRSGVAQVTRVLGNIDVLVNNAGIVNNIAPVARMSPDAWQREVAVNLSGAFNMIQAVIDPMVDCGWGRIINISSLGAIGGLHRQAAYAASKAGLLGLTKTVALEHARHGITCNAVIPGLIATELVMSMPEQIREHATAMIPSGRIGEMEEVGELIAFLASDQAAYINGEQIHIDGGMQLNATTLASRKELR